MKWTKVIVCVVTFFWTTAGAIELSVRAQESSASKAGDPGAAPDFHGFQTNAIEVQLLSENLDRFAKAHSAVVGDPSKENKSRMRLEAKALQAQLPKARSNLRRLIAELKSQRQWNPSYDEYVEKKLTSLGASADFVRFIREQGGARAVMKKLVTAEATADLKSDVDSKLKSVGANKFTLFDLLVPPAYAKCIKCHCLWFAAVAAITIETPPLSLAACTAGIACVNAS
jgi:hypothetical protein